MPASEPGCSEGCHAGHRRNADKRCGAAPENQRAFRSHSTTQHLCRQKHMTSLSLLRGPSNGLGKGVILSYHRIASRAPDPWGLRVTEAVFAEQMAALRTIAEPVTLQKLATGHRSCDGRPVVAVTFDDGYNDNLSRALPHLLMQNVPATVFVSTAYTGRRHFWWDVMEQVFLTPGSLPLQLALQHSGQRFSWLLGPAANYSESQYAADSRAFRWGGEPETRIRLYFDVHEALWSFPVEARMDLAEDILAWSGFAPEGSEVTRPLTAAELVRLASHELISIGSHTVSHPALDTLPPPCQRAEILGNRAFLEELTGRPVDTFAYPHGRHSDESLRVLREAGFSAACTTRVAAAHPGCDPLLLPRLAVKNWTATEFVARLTEVLEA